MRTWREQEAVFGVKETLIDDFVRRDDANQAKALGFARAFWCLDWDFVLPSG